MDFGLRYKADTLFNLLDALCRDGDQCQSVVELSQSISFERKYSSITDAIRRGLKEADFKGIQALTFAATKALPLKPHLFFTDCTANPRPYAKTLLERGIVHAPNPGAGRKKLFGDKVLLSDKTTHPTPHLIQSTTMKTAKGKEYRVELTLFKDLLLRGFKEFASQNHSLNILRAVVKDADGKPIFQRPLWLGLIGEGRDEITPEMAYESYRTRYDIEHFFRFGKQKLLPWF